MISKTDSTLFRYAKEHMPVKACKAGLVFAWSFDAIDRQSIDRTRDVFELQAELRLEFRCRWSADPHSAGRKSRGPTAARRIRRCPQVEVITSLHSGLVHVARRLER